MNMNDVQFKDVVISVVIAAVMAAAAFAMIKKKLTTHTKFTEVPGFPLFGNFFDFDISVILKRMKAHQAKFGKIFLLNAVGRKILHVGDAQLCRELLAKRPKQLKRGAKMEGMAARMGYLPYGLYHSTDHIIWGNMKKMATPVFCKENVQNMSKVFLEEVMVFVERLTDQAASGVVVNVLQETNLLTTRVISRAAFGDQKVDYFFGQQFCDDHNEASKLFLGDVTFSLPHWAWLLTPMLHQTEELRVVEGNKRLAVACQEVINHKRCQHARMSEEEKRAQHSLVDIMLLQEGITDEAILANVKTCYLAGSDTTSVTLSWALFLLCQHPAQIARMRTETMSVFALPLQELTSAALSDAVASMTFIAAVLKEAVRLYPIYPLISLDFLESEPVTLSDGMVITSDHTLLLNAMTSMLDAESFEYPTAFFPARWLTDDAAALKRMELAFLGFGGGPRACPGMGMALSETALALAALVHYFDFELGCPEEEVRVDYKFTMQPSQLPVRFFRRAPQQ